MPPVFFLLSLLSGGCSPFPLFRCISLSGMCVDNILPGFSVLSPLSFLFRNPRLVALPRCSVGCLPSACVSWQSRCHCSNRQAHCALSGQCESVAPQRLCLCRSLENVVGLLCFFSRTAARPICAQIMDVDGHMFEACAPDSCFTLCQPGC